MYALGLFLDWPRWGAGKLIALTVTAGFLGGILRRSPLPIIHHHTRVVLPHPHPHPHRLRHSRFA